MEKKESDKKIETGEKGISSLEREIVIGR